MVLNQVLRQCIDRRMFVKNRWTQRLDFQAATQGIEHFEDHQRIDTLILKCRVGVELTGGCSQHLGQCLSQHRDQRFGKVFRISGA